MRRVLSPSQGRVSTPGFAFRASSRALKVVEAEAGGASRLQPNCSLGSAMGQRVRGLL
jgi:hypothetical protein